MTLFLIWKVKVRKSCRQRVTKARSLEYRFARFQLDTRPSLAIFPDSQSEDCYYFLFINSFAPAENFKIIGLWM